MCDGRIAREDLVGTPIEEDIKNWRHSILGQQILSNKHSELENLDIPEKSIQAMRHFLIITEPHKGGQSLSVMEQFRER